MEFWNSELTEKSLQILMSLRKYNFVLIGGWAAYFWTKMHKSKDIDIVIKNFDDLAILKKEFTLVKNDHLKKYEIKIDEIDVDIYAPFYSQLAIPVEDIATYSSKIENFDIVSPEVLLILKQGAEEDREHSVKGDKDRVDIMALVCFAELDFAFYHALLKKYKLERFYGRLQKIVQNFTEFKYLDLNQHSFKKKDILDKIKKR